jgi:2-iminobutanoate/2-iminopropanoate deaminase
MKKIIKTDKAPAPIGPYNQAVLVNGTLYISGQIPMNPATKDLEMKDISTQAKQVMENLKEILKEAGMDFSNVVKTSIFLTDMQNFKDVNGIYSSYFTSDFPARETVQVSKLPANADVEISMIAAL